MASKILQLLSSLPKELYVFIRSMLPIIELRGAIPIGAVLDIPFYLNFILAVAGNILPVPFILLFIPKILDLMERVRIFKPIVDWLRGKAQKHSKRVFGKEKAGQIADESVREKSDTVTEAYEADEEKRISARTMSTAIFIGLILFVALPVPGTGAWTGALVASLFDLPKKQSALAIFIGVLTCAIIMTLASYGVLGFLSFLI